MLLLNVKHILNLKKTTDSNGAYSFSLSDFEIHHSHTSRELSYYRNSITQSQKEIFINSFQEKPGDVRLKLPNTSFQPTSRQLTYLRQKGKKQFNKQKTSQFSDAYGHFTLFHKNQDETFDEALFINKIIQDSKLGSNNFAIIDATNGVTDKKLPLEVISIGSSSYHYMSDETAESYEKMFNLFKSNFPNIFVFLGDRSNSQISAFKNVYKEKGVYLFCHRHLIANIKVKAPKFHELFCEFLYSRSISPDQFEQTVSESHHETGYQYVEDLIKLKKHWYPEFYALAGVNNVNTTNTAEGLFGLLKQNYTFPQNNDLLLITISHWAQNQIVEILRSVAILNHSFLNYRDIICKYFPILQPIIDKLGQRGIDYYLDQISKLNDNQNFLGLSQNIDFSGMKEFKYDLNYCLYCHQKEYKNDSKILYPPCWHYLAEFQSIDINSIPSIYLNVEISNDFSIHKEEKINVPSKSESSKKLQYSLSLLNQNYQTSPTQNQEISKIICGGRPQVHIRNNVKNQISKSKQRKQISNKNNKQKGSIHM